MSLSRRTLLAAAALGACAPAGACSTTRAPAAYAANPTGGTEGTFSDKDDLGYEDGRGRISRYHLRAAHLSGPGPFPMVVHLHGDGAQEFDDLTGSTFPAYVQTARDAGAVFLLPRTPDRSGAATWWEHYSSTQWLADFLRWEYGKYDIDRNRVYVSGYSGGAQTASYNLIGDDHSLFTGGGAMLLGGGGARGMAFTGVPAGGLRTRFLMRWHVGEHDDGSASDDGFDALRASQQGYDFYRRAGWNARRTTIPDVDHDASEPYGPTLLAGLIAESASLYGI